jgi:hypothetical protein
MPRILDPLHLTQENAGLAESREYRPQNRVGLELLVALFTGLNMKTVRYCWPLKSCHVGDLKGLVLQGSIGSWVIVPHYTMAAPTLIVYLNIL